MLYSLLGSTSKARSSRLTPFGHSNGPPARDMWEEIDDRKQTNTHSKYTKPNVSHDFTCSRTVFPRWKGKAFMPSIMPLFAYCGIESWKVNDR